MPKLSANVDYKYFTNLPYQLMLLSTFVPTAPEGEFKEAQFAVPHNINANLQLTIPLYNPHISGCSETNILATEVAQLKQEKPRANLFKSFQALLQCIHKSQIRPKQVSISEEPKSLQIV